MLFFFLGYTGINKILVVRGPNKAGVKGER
jgi:hypothetical protein